MMVSACTWPPVQSEIGDLVRATDWSATPLGPMLDWPASLRVAVSAVLDSPMPMIVLWGPQLIQIYNTAYYPILGSRHPAAMGQPTQLCWPEVWHFNAPIYQNVMATGKCVHFEDQEFIIEPFGQPEAHYFTVSYLPARDEDGVVRGINVIVLDTTTRVCAERDNIALLTAAQLSATRLGVLNAELASRVWLLEKAEKRQAFQLQISDLLRRLSEPEVIFSTTSALLGRYLNVCRVLYASVAGPSLTFHSNYTDGTVPELNGTYPAEAIGSAHFSALEEGLTTISSAAQEIGPVFAADNMHSAILMPFHRSGVLIATLVVNQCLARAWTEEELMLMDDVGERVWNAVERLHAEQQQRYAEAQLRASQERFRLLLESSGEGICGIGRDYSCSFINTAGAAMLGYRPEELLGRDIGRIVNPGVSRAESDRLLVQANREGGAIRIEDQMFLKKAGAALAVSYSMRPMLVDGRVAGAVITYSDITERKRVEQVMLQSKVRLHQLLAHQEQIKEEERKRIAREIHDDLGQNLMALRIDISMLHARSAQRHPRLHGWVAGALQNIDATIKSVRSIINDLRPFELELGLQAAVEWQLKRFERISGVVCQLSIDDSSHGYALGDERTLAVFRILQESLNNILRHSVADQAQVMLSRDATIFSMTVQDNGIGFSPDDRRHSKTFGLMGIRERLNSFGGHLVIDNNNGQGTRLSISLPVEISSPALAVETGSPALRS